MDQPIAPPQTSGKATGSLIAGIIGLLCIPLIPAIVAVVLGHMAKSQIRKSNGTLGGEGLALGGLITGYIGVVLGAVVAISLGLAMTLPAFSAAKGAAQKNASMQNIRMMVNACQQYGLENEGTLPNQLSDLDTYFGHDGAPTESPLGAGGGSDYVLLLPGKKLTEIEDSTTTILIEDNAAKAKGYRLVGYADGHVEEIGFLDDTVFEGLDDAFDDAGGWQVEEEPSGPESR